MVCGQFHGPQDITHIQFHMTQVLVCDTNFFKIFLQKYVEMWKSVFDKVPP